MKLRSSKRTSIIGAGRMIVARRRPEQVIEPFAVGTLSFAAASLDDGMLTGPAYFGFQLADYGLGGVTIRDDAVSGRNVSMIKAAIPGVLSAISGLPDPVIVLSSPLGNDVTEAFNSYGRADAAPDGFWAQRMTDVDDIANLCAAAGVRVIWGNTSYRNYGLDGRCRTDPDIGSHYVNRVHFEPWLRNRYPDQWDNAADRPVLDDYANTWLVADWTLIDHVHCSSLGYHQRRRWMASRLAALAAGVIPSRLPAPQWPIIISDGVEAVPHCIYSFGNLTAATNVPAPINAIAFTSGAAVYPPVSTDVAGAQAPNSTARIYGVVAGANNARGNVGDETISLTNGALLIGNCYATSADGMFVEVGTGVPSAAVTVKYNASAAYTATAGDRVTRVAINSPLSVYQDHIADEAAPGDLLEFDGVVTDGLGFVYARLFRATGGTNTYVSGIEILGSAV